MHGDMGAWGWWMMVLMPLIWISLPALIAWAVWAAARPRSGSPTLLDLLKDSYACGRITRDQFEQAKKDLA